MGNSVRKRKESSNRVSSASGSQAPDTVIGSSSNLTSGMKKPTKTKSTQVGGLRNYFEEEYDGEDEAGPAPFCMPKRWKRSGYDGDDEGDLPDYLGLGDQVSIQHDPFHAYVYEERRDIPPEFLSQLRVTRIHRMTTEDRDRRGTEFSERENEALERHQARHLTARKERLDQKRISETFEEDLLDARRSSGADVKRSRKSFSPERYRPRQRRRRRKKKLPKNESQKFEGSKKHRRPENKSPEISEVKLNTLIISSSSTSSSSEIYESEIETEDSENEKPLESISQRLNLGRDSVLALPDLKPKVVEVEGQNRVILEEVLVEQGPGPKDYVKIARHQRNRLAKEKAKDDESSSTNSSSSGDSKIKPVPTQKPSTWVKGPVPAPNKSYIPYTFETGPGALRFFDKITKLMVRHEVLSYSSTKKIKEKYDLLDRNAHRVIALHKVYGGIFGQRTELLGIDFYNERWSLKFSFHGPRVGYKRKVVVYAPKSEIGRVEQAWSLSPFFKVKDRSGRIIATIGRVRDANLGVLNGAFIIFDEIGEPIGDIRDNCSDLANFPHIFASHRSFGIHYYSGKRVGFNLKAKLLAATMLIYKTYFDGKVLKRVLNDPTDAQWREFISESNEVSEEFAPVFWEYPQVEPTGINVNELPNCTESPEAQ